MLLLIVPFYALASHFGYDDRGFVAGLFIGSVSFAARAHWDSRKRGAYWIIVALLVLVHIPLVVLPPWPTWKLSSAACMPIMFLDFLANFAVFRWALMATNRNGREASVP
jgi:hypothetical protein